MSHALLWGDPTPPLLTHITTTQGHSLPVSCQILIFPLFLFFAFLPFLFLEENGNIQQLRKNQKGMSSGNYLGKMDLGGGARWERRGEK